jgi:hypothetical protein
MRKFVQLLLVALFLVGFAKIAQSQVRIDKFPAGLQPVSSGWRMHLGDDPAWAQPAYDDTAWRQVTPKNLPPLEGPSVWYRLRLELPAKGPALAMFLLAEEGSYEAYVNGQRVQDIRFKPWWMVGNPRGVSVPIPSGDGPVVIAVSVHAPTFDRLNWVGSIDAAVGSPEAVKERVDRRASDRFVRLLPSVSINTVLVIAGIGVLLLFGAQRQSREYLWLGIYLVLLGSSFGLLSVTSTGVGPGSLNDLYADPAIFIFTIAQIEFSYAFIRRKPGRVWRAYEVVLLATLVTTCINLMGWMPFGIYYLIESVVVLPAACALPVMLFYWYRRGSREAGWLIVPSLFPAAGVIVTNLDPIGAMFHVDLRFLLTPIHLWQKVPINDYDIADGIFLIAIGIVMFFRFTRVSREQARSSAELEAARRIQQRLVPAQLLTPSGCQLQAAYIPAAEVGGDFYQVLEQANGSTLIVLGDVSGKGVEAAMTGALAIGTLRTLAAQQLAPATLLTLLNRQMVNAQNDGFITMLCVRIDVSGNLTVANAGHLAPYLNGKEGSVDSGLPLGLTASATYTESTLCLEGGDQLTMLTDGVLEARAKTGELYGFSRTAAISNQTADSIAQLAREFGQEDDITVLTLTRLTVYQAETVATDPLLVPA